MIQLNLPTLPAWSWDMVTLPCSPYQAFLIDDQTLAWLGNPTSILVRIRGNKLGIGICIASPHKKLFPPIRWTNEHDQWAIAHITHWYRMPCCVVPEPIPWSNAHHDRPFAVHIIQGVARLLWHPYNKTIYDPHTDTYWEVAHECLSGFTSW